MTINNDMQSTPLVVTCNFAQPIECFVLNCNKIVLTNQEIKVDLDAEFGHRYKTIIINGVKYERRK